MKNFDYFIIDYHHIPKTSNIAMTVDASNSECYGIFEVPEEAAKLIKDKPLPYRLKVDHNVKDLWGRSTYYHKNPEDFENLKKEFIKACENKEVEWSDPNIQCHHCGKYFDPSYDIIEDDGLLAFCMNGYDEYKYPNYCPSCIQELYDFCNDAEAAFTERDMIKEKN